MFFSCGRYHKKWLEEKGLVDFLKKDMKLSQLCCISTFPSGEDIFHHVVEANDNGSLVHLRLMHYLSMLYEEEIKQPKKRKRVSVYHNIQLDITNCCTFCIKCKKLITIYFTIQKQD